MEGLCHGVAQYPRITSIWLIQYKSTFSSPTARLRARFRLSRAISRSLRSRSRGLGRPVSRAARHAPEGRRAGGRDESTARLIARRDIMSPPPRDRPRDEGALSDKQAPRPVTLRAARSLPGPVPVRAFALRAHARLVLRVSRYPLVTATLTSVLIDGDLLLSHARTIYLK